MSVGVNLLFEISRQVASHLGDGYDAEILEAHHRGKADSPSGTAIALAEAVAAGLGSELEDVARYERHGRIGARKKGEIGIQTLRGGDVVGDHTVMFLGDGERVELTHRAASRENFSAGAVRAAKWIPGKPPGSTRCGTCSDSDPARLSTMYRFRLIEKEKGGSARLGEIRTSRETIETPAFMPVATQGAGKAVTPLDLRRLGFGVLIANAYHLYLRPGTDIISSSAGFTATCRGTARSSPTAAATRS